jgi:hypothetical protein
LAKEYKMKFIVLIGVVALAATTFTPLAHASAAFGNLDRGIFNSSDERLNSKNRGSTRIKSKFPDFGFKMRPSATKDKKNKTDSIKHSRSKGKKNNKDSNDVSVPSPNTGDSGDVKNKPTPPQTPQTPQKPSVGDNGNDPSNNGGNNTNPPQLNSHDIKGFDPFGGLYGPGT